MRPRGERARQHAPTGGPRSDRAPRSAASPGSRIAARVSRRGVRDHRRERRGQVHAAAHHRRPAPADRRIDHVRRQGHDEGPAGAPGYWGNRHGAGGSAAVRIAHGRGEPAGRRDVRAEGTVDNRARVRAVRLDEGPPDPAHGAVVRRRAAIGRHRPGAGRQPARADARRAFPRPGAGGRAAHLRHAAADPGYRAHRVAGGAGRQPGAPGGVASAVPARGSYHPGRQAVGRHAGAGRGRVLRPRDLGGSGQPPRERARGAASPSPAGHGGAASPQGGPGGMGLSQGGSGGMGPPGRSSGGVWGGRPPEEVQSRGGLGGIVPPEETESLWPGSTPSSRES